jgi:hypothetical protein
MDIPQFLAVVLKADTCIKIAKMIAPAIENNGGRILRTLQEDSKCFTVQMRAKSHII